MPTRDLVLVGAQLEGNLTPFQALSLGWMPRQETGGAPPLSGAEEDRFRPLRRRQRDQRLPLLLGYQHVRRRALRTRSRQQRAVWLSDASATPPARLAPRPRPPARTNPDHA